MLGVLVGSVPIRSVQKEVAHLMFEICEESCLLMNYEELLDQLTDNMAWNILNRKVLCEAKNYIILELHSTIHRLLEIKNDDVRRETVCCINELYDEAGIFSGIEAIDECDVRLRDKLMGFLSDGL